MKRKVLLTAEHHNWGMHTLDDWMQTKYILFEDGALQSVVFGHRTIISKERTLSPEELSFIKDNIKNFVFNSPDVDACDGDAWEFQGPDFEFDLRYIYGTKLEEIAEILLGKEPEE